MAALRRPCKNPSFLIAVAEALATFGERSLAFGTLLHVAENAQWNEKDVKKRATTALDPLWDAASFDQLLDAAISDDTAIANKALDLLKANDDPRRTDALTAVASLQEKRDHWDRILEARSAPGFQEWAEGGGLVDEYEYRERTDLDQQRPTLQASSRRNDRPLAGSSFP